MPIGFTDFSPIKWRLGCVKMCSDICINLIQRFNALRQGHYGSLPSRTQRPFPFATEAQHAEQFVDMSFEQLPDEIINQLLSYVAPGDILASLQLVSRRLYRLSDEPLLWRHHCLASFRFWHPSHDLQNKLQLAPSEFEWKGLFALRDSRDSRIAELFDEIIATKVSRLRKIEEICLLGYDAKDFLLRQCHTDDTVEDVLARR